MKLKTLIFLAGMGSLLIKYYVDIPPANPEYQDIYKFFSDDIVPAELIRAVAIVESGENERAYNPVDPSYGLMQILWTGKNKLYVDGWPPTSENDLYNPVYNVKIGSQILRYNIKKFGFFRGIISYNNWSAREGFLPLKSIDYFMKVFVTYLRLKNAG